MGDGIWMELRQLRYFLAVAECGNFTRGAEKAAISQPSLSVQIAALEDELGAPLFDRLGRHAALTEAGRLFRDHAQRVIRETELAAQSIRDLIGAEQGRLVIGALSTVNSYLIPPLVCRFKQQFPHVHLQVHAQPSSIIEEAVAANRLDLGLCLLPATNDRLITSRLFTETLVLVSPPGIRLTAKRIRMRDLATLPLVLLPNDYCLRKMIEAECALVGVRPQVSVEMTSPEGILEAVKQGVGLTILPELFVRHRIGGSLLRVIELYDPVPRHDVGVVSLAHRHLGKAAQEFVRLCRTTLGDLQIDHDHAPPQKIPSDVSSAVDR
ncbi:MAG TPA: LysR substrate-binding domain-containing protein [Nitrospiraceae bacterium]|nr:LysR substrate-binding domain-containing protein [Nitrospiraceae bacterium]